MSLATATSDRMSANSTQTLSALAGDANAMNAKRNFFILVPCVL